MNSPRATGAQDERSKTAKLGIAELHLLTSKLEALHQFYKETLGFPVIDDERGSITIRAGATDITFKQQDAAPETPPNYHFAFNIPENKISAAQMWQRARTALLRWKGADKERLQDEIIHLKKWNAHSVFFRDPAGNLVEYIARHNLKNMSPGGFSSADILYASEIGLVTDDVPGAVAAQKRSLGLKAFHGGSKAFTAMGDEHRLLINVKSGRPWIPAKERIAKAHPVRAVVRGVSGDFIDKKNGYRVSSTPQREP